MSNDVIEPQYVGFWIRFLAFLIDSTVASLLIAPIAVLVIGSDISINDPAQMLAQLPEIAKHLTIQSILFAILSVLLWIWLASTPGKMIFNAYIADQHTFARASKRQLVIRYLGYFVSMLGFMFGFLWISFDPRKQGWHDKMAGTVVIKGKPRAAAAEEGVDR